jgi:hypothetical protein
MKNEMIYPPKGEGWFLLLAVIALIALVVVIMAMAAC